MSKAQIEQLAQRGYKRAANVAHKALGVNVEKDWFDLRPETRLGYFEFVKFILRESKKLNTAK